MRCFPFAILAYLFVAVQFSLGGVAGLGQATPNLVLLLVIFIGLHAPTDPAMMAGLVLGLMHDVVASHGIGAYALAYPVVAAVTVQLRSTMYADHAATHVTLALLHGGGLTLYLLLRQWVRGWYFTQEPTVTLRGQLLGTVLTATLAWPTIWCLRKVRRSFAFEKRD